MKIRVYAMSRALETFPDVDEIQTFAPDVDSGYSDSQAINLIQATIGHEWNCLCIEEKETES